MANQYIQTLVQKEVTRKQFIVICGLAMLSVVGLDSLIKLFTGSSLADHPALRTTVAKPQAYGGSLAQDKVTRS